MPNGFISLEVDHWKKRKPQKSVYTTSFQNEIWDVQPMEKISSDFIKQALICPIYESSLHHDDADAYNGFQ